MSRIKAFITKNNISVSQFADSCIIPRPTVSQLLNGRNKKVSDEILTKIHNAYPNLSISWLLFGEGTMNSNDVEAIEDNQSSDAVENQKFPMGIDDNELFRNLSGFNLGVERENSDLSSSSLAQLQLDGVPNNNSLNNSQKNSEAESVQKSSTAIDNERKKVVNIIVFYSDNSFEYFKPVIK
ncbi:MAG: helix-turn-helix transcriptional regulator [Muribaculaceae bacterium]|nr:helix-turn-helix transcriptional regulator [Muribaculaceae bacterium]